MSQRTTDVCFAGYPGAVRSRLVVRGKIPAVKGAHQVCGTLRCLGPPARLKRKYGSGYQLEVAGAGPGAAVEAAVQRLAPGSEVTAAQGST